MSEVNIIRPTVITDALFFGSDVAETDYTAWSSGTTYVAGDHCIVASTHLIYEALANQGIEVITLDVSPTADWVEDDIVTGFTSGKKCVVVEKLTATTYRVKERDGDFTLGEIVGVVGWSAKQADQGAAKPTFAAATNLNNDPTVDLALETPRWWKVTSATNRWKSFDDKIGSQTSKTTSFTHVLIPGIIDSIACMNLDATSLRVTSANQGDDLVTNGTAWTGATGTTQPTSWSKVGTPSDFTIDSGALKITVDAANEGISQTITVTAATQYQLLFLYRNTAGDTAQYAVYDVTHSADILATTDLTTTTTNSVGSYIFTTPAGCTSIKISLLAKANGDIVWFDSCSLAPVVFDETVDLLSRTVTGWYEWFFEEFVYKTKSVMLDLPPYIDASITVTVTKTGGTALAGEIVVGKKRKIGYLRPGPSPGFIDYSTKTADDDGEYIIEERPFSDRLDCDIIVQKEVLDEVLRLVAFYRAQPIVLVAWEDYTCMMLYGFFKEFVPVLNDPGVTICSVLFEGLT